MSTMQEIKSAVSALSTEERAELVRWLSEETTTYRQMTPEEHKRWCEELTKLREKTHFELGPVTWTRDDLHKR